MSHMTDDRLVAYLDGELPGEERVETAHHLRRCPSCRVELESLRAVSRSLAAALETLDVPAPEGSAEELRRRHRERREGVAGRRRPEVETPPARPRSPRRPRPPGRPRKPGESDDVSAGASEGSRRTLLAAAVLLIAVVGGAAAAIPGSPVREWLSRSVERVVALVGGEGAEEATVTSPDTLAIAGSGVAVEPARGRVRIVLTDPAPDALVRVRIVDAARASVRAEGSYRTSAGRIEVLGARGEVRIELPGRGTSARVEVDGRTVLETSDADVRFLAPTADSAGAEIFFRPGG